MTRLFREADTGNSGSGGEQDFLKYVQETNDIIRQKDEEITELYKIKKSYEEINESLIAKKIANNQQIASLQSDNDAFISQVEAMGEEIKQRKEREESLQSELERVKDLLTLVLEEREPIHEQYSIIGQLRDDILNNLKQSKEVNNG